MKYERLTERNERLGNIIYLGNNAYIDQDMNFNNLLMFMGKR